MGLAVLVLAGARARTNAALEHPAFDTERSAGLLRSDPALLFHFTELIVAAGGRAPDGFRADPRVQFPDRTDVAAEFTVGQEFLVAWCYLVSGSALPLHVFCVHVMALVAALAVLGVFGVVFWRTGSPAWAFVASALFCSIPANYRTIGFVLVREDLSFPLFALHLALLARAARRPGARAFLLAGFAAAAAAATWHATGFFLTLELLALHAWFVRGGPSPFEASGAWTVLVGPIIAGVAVPALAAGNFLLGIPMQLAFALVCVAAVRCRAAARSPALGPRAFAWVGGVAWALLFGLTRLFSPGRSSYAHVLDMLVAKLRHLGVRPADPSAIPFDARLLWQGPFESLPASQLFVWVGGVGALVLAGALVAAIVRRTRLDGFELFLVLLAVSSLPVAWLIGRTVILVGLCIPLSFAVIHRASSSRVRRGLLGALGVLTLVQAVSFSEDLDAWDLSWYLPVWRQDELAEVVEWIDANVDASEPIAADFVNSTAILANTENPIVLQPKYETEASRRKAQLFLETFFTGTPDEFARTLRDRFGCSYVVLDTFLLGAPMRWTAGLSGEPGIGSAAHALLGDGSTPGFDEVFRTGVEAPRRAGAVGGELRVYRLTRED